MITTEAVGSPKVSIPPLPDLSTRPKIVKPVHRLKVLFGTIREEAEQNLEEIAQVMHGYEEVDVRDPENMLMTEVAF